MVKQLAKFEKKKQVGGNGVRVHAICIHAGVSGVHVQQH